MPSSRSLEQPPAEDKPGDSSWRDRWHTIIFEADTPGGKRFDLAIVLLVTVSIVAVCLESVRELRERYGPALYAIEWVVTALFTIEYTARLATVRKPWKYALSFFGIVDLLAIL